MCIRDRRMNRPGGDIVDVGARQAGGGVPVGVVLVDPGVLAGFHILPQLDAREDGDVPEVLHIDVFVAAVEVVVQPSARIAAGGRLVERRLADGAPGVGPRQSDDHHQHRREDGGYLFFAFRLHVRSPLMELSLIHI